MIAFLFRQLMALAYVGINSAVLSEGNNENVHKWYSMIFTRTYIYVYSIEVFIIGNNGIMNRELTRNELSMYAWGVLDSQQ
ncbi:hypothetical protein T12_10130 [Trichinella patagoniensis]|uniref:Uncharacterized protein n=1 Tax=Trichinella patagoniensis TaxID=990121 RepID=A0A0V0ZS98_9BILA|nr:hypothetical protein T12_10130 [Trichinella patagoniensis]